MKSALVDLLYLFVLTLAGAAFLFGLETCR
jgi:hypothetical protein